MVECLPLAQVVILESWDQVPHQTPCGKPAFPSAYVSAPLSVSHEEINKILKIIIIFFQLYIESYTQRLKHIRLANIC